jgi:hypothetical protein
LRNSDRTRHAERVNYACACIVRGHIQGRTFFTCFEMADGDAVSVAVYRRSLKNPKLAAKIWGALAQSCVMDKVAQLADVPTRKLPEVAREMRAEFDRNFSIGGPGRHGDGQQDGASQNAWPP